MCVVDVFYVHKYVLMCTHNFVGFFCVCDVHILCVGKCVLMNLGVEARGQHQVSSLAIIHLVFFETGSFTNPGPHQVGQTGWPVSSGICLSLPSAPCPFVTGFHGFELTIKQKMT